VSRKEDQNDRTQVQVHDPLVGTTFDGRFHIDFRIAIGGFGAIYHATHKKSGHQFALKILHARLANDAGVIARFRREGETLTRLRNPHTIIAYELGETDDGTLFIVLELLQGESLFERFRARGPFPWKEMAAIARGVCHSLEEAHRLGIIHRDLKPTNINLERNDEQNTSDFVKVLDFGIAKILRESEMDSADLTNAGQMIGTLDYMSPEQMVGGHVTGQTDIYTLGIVMYEMIAGKRPFAEATSPAAVLAAMLRGAPEALSSIKPVPKAIDRVVMKCLERDVLQRWQTVAQVGAALDAVLRGEVLDERADVTQTAPFDLDDNADSTVFEARPRSTAPYPAQAAARKLGEAPTEPAPMLRTKAPSQSGTTRGSQPALAGMTPTPVTTRKDSASSIPAKSTHGGRDSEPNLPASGLAPPGRKPPATPPAAGGQLFSTSTPFPANPASPASDPRAPTPVVGQRTAGSAGFPPIGPPTVVATPPGTRIPPASSAPTMIARDGSGRTNQSGAPTVVARDGSGRGTNPNVPTAGPTAPTPVPGSMTTPYPGNAPVAGAYSKTSQSGGMAQPLPGTGLALFPPQGAPMRNPPTQPPPMEVLAPPGPHQPLPYAPDRPVMDLASFAPPVYPGQEYAQGQMPPQAGMMGFDMSQMAARDAAVRRFVWIVVLAVAAVIGIIVASQL
jgi:eukaryotic-like serine/threonine-protein kinase